MLKAKIVVIALDGAADALFAYKAKPTDDVIAAYRAKIAAGNLTGTLVNGGDEATIARALKLV